MPYVDMLITTKNLKPAFARLKQFGIYMRLVPPTYTPVYDDDGEIIDNVLNNPDKAGGILGKIEECAEHCMTPPIQSEIDNAYRFVIRMTEEQAAKLDGFPDTPNLNSELVTEDFVWPDFCGRIAQ